MLSRRIHVFGVLKQMELSTCPTFGIDIVDATTTYYKVTDFKHSELASIKCLQLPNDMKSKVTCGWKDRSTCKIPKQAAELKPRVMSAFREYQAAQF